MADPVNRRAIQADFSSRLSRLGVKHRRELQNLLGDPPDIMNVPADFWTRVQKETEDTAAALLLLIFLGTGTRFGLKPNESQAKGLIFAQQRARFLGSEFVQASRKRLERASAEWRRRARIGERITQADVRLQTVPVFGPTRADTIATTETTVAATAATRELKDDAEGFNVPDLKLIWKLGPCKHCKFCPYMHNHSRSFWGQFMPKGPPAHVNCCCTLEWMPGTTKEPPIPSTAAVMKAAKQSGIFR